MSTTTRSIDDAIHIADVSHDAVQDSGYEPDGDNMRRLAIAAQQLVQEIYALRAELERERARSRDLARPERPRAEGHPLRDGKDSGGRRHWLGGRPVHAGQPLYLLTLLGWYAVRYESNMPKGPALLYFDLPGAREESVVAIPDGDSGVRLAWPDELRRPGWSLFDRSAWNF